MNKLNSSSLCAVVILTCSVAWGSVAWGDTNYVKFDVSPPGTARAATTIVEAKRHRTVQEASDLVGRMSLRANRVHRWLRDARSRNDFRRARCLDDMLSRTHALEHMGHAEVDAIVSAIRSHHTSHAQRLLARLTRYDQRAAQLIAVAHNCGMRVSARPRMKTGYTVKVIAPRLTALSDVPLRRRADASVRPQPR